MRRSSVLSLREERWVKVTETDDLEVRVVPSAYTAIASLRDDTPTDQQKADICRRVFVDFKNYTEDDGTPVKNSLAARLELIDAAVVFYAIQVELIDVHSEIAKGEEVAA